MTMKAQTTLENEFKKHYSQADRQLKDPLKRKLKHSYQTLDIASKIFLLSENQKEMLLLHDIGRFTQFYDSESFQHADFGFRFLMEIGFDMKTVLPIKYHEIDTGWKNLIANDNYFINLADTDKKEVLFNAELLKDMDIVSNMEEQIESKVILSSSMNLNIIKCLLNGEICDSRDEVKSEIDKILYILCGIYIINLEETKNYISSNRIVSKLFSKAYKTINNCSKMKECIYKSEVFMYNKFKWLT